jgi:hypothetical protein
MITPKEAMESPELMIKHKDMFKNIKIFRYPWHDVFHRHPHLYREFSDRFDEMTRAGIYIALRDDPTLVSDLKDHLHILIGIDIASAVREVPALVLGLKNYLHKIDEEHLNWLSDYLPGLSLCLKYKDDPDKVEAAYYIGHPHKLDNLNKEEKREIGKKIIEFLKEEKI